jgi:hypothetical protein
MYIDGNIMVGEMLEIIFNPHFFCAVLGSAANAFSGYYYVIIRSLLLFIRVVLILKYQHLTGELFSRLTVFT